MYVHIIILPANTIIAFFIETFFLLLMNEMVLTKKIVVLILLLYVIVNEKFELRDKFLKGDMVACYSTKNVVVA